ncbi:MAG: branched-chain amino acid ABC transporter permease [Alphaproteobacteria bacterium]|nr:branched-chain amino acid ABC transporter permease [Alphaproteobacteria bacterium]
MDELYFFLEVLIGGLLSGTMYSLVALGFVLIYKASGIFNFAQGTMVLFAALTFVGVLELGAPALLAAVVTLAVMVVLAFAVERLVFRHMVNQPQVILFMATIGLAYFLEGLGQTIWGTEVHVLDLGIPDRGLWLGPILVSQFDLIAAVVVALLVAALGVFFRTTTMGRALRGVADDHQAALSIGIPLHHVWVAVWSVAGFVALVAGLVWGSKLGVQFSISLVALKAIPVMIIGGFTSIPGAIVGGLIVGASEKLAEVYIGPFVGGGLENWFPYMLAMLVLMVRPEGLFGEKIIERV